MYGKAPDGPGVVAVSRGSQQEDDGARRATARRHGAVTRMKLAEFTADHGWQVDLRWRHRASVRIPVDSPRKRGTPADVRLGFLKAVSIGQQVKLPTP
jgi:hypothetical protein